MTISRQIHNFVLLVFFEELFSNFCEKIKIEFVRNYVKYFYHDDITAIN